jgi:hypothetical protein
LNRPLENGVGYRKCEAPCGPFRLLVPDLTPFSLSTRNRKRDNAVVTSADRKTTAAAFRRRKPS